MIHIRVTHIIFALAAMCPAIASTSHATEPSRVTLDLRAAPLPAALREIQESSGLHLAFSDDLVKDAEPVTLSVKDEPVDDVLRKILRPRGYRRLLSVLDFTRSHP